jgi:methyl-accepting chemotaxis protein
VGEIAAASAEQSTGIEQVNAAMTQMDQVTQSNSAQTEELSATAQALSHQAASLLQLIQQFRLDIENENTAGGHPRGLQSHDSSFSTRHPGSSRPAAKRQPSRTPAFAAVAAGPVAMEAGFEEF